MNRLVTLHRVFNEMVYWKNRKTGKTRKELLKSSKGFENQDMESIESNGQKTVLR